MSLSATRALAPPTQETDHGPRNHSHLLHHPYGNGGAAVGSDRRKEPTAGSARSACPVAAFAARSLREHHPHRSSAGKSGWQMRMSAPNVAAAAVTLLLIGCHPSGTTDIPEYDGPALTGIETPPTHLEELEGLYRDRERLSSRGGVEYAAEWRMGLSEAREHVSDLIQFHVVGYWSQQLSENAAGMPSSMLEAIEHVSGLIATYVNVTIEDVKDDVSIALRGWWPNVTRTSEGEAAHTADGDCVGSVWATSRSANITRRPRLIPA